MIGGEIEDVAHILGHCCCYRWFRKHMCTKVKKYILDIRTYSICREEFHKVGDTRQGLCPMAELLSGKKGRINCKNLSSLICSVHAQRNTLWSVDFATVVSTELTA